MKSSRLTKLFTGAALILCLASCSKGARIDATIQNAPGADVIIKRLDVGEYKVLDTVKTNASGSFTYKMDVQKGDPEFVYLFHGDRKIASLILLQGDNVKVSADTLGKSYSVEGSEESAKLVDVEKKFAEFTSAFSATANKVLSVTEDAEAIKDIQRELSKLYVNYYRSSVKYVLENPFSLATIPLLYQEINENFPVFSQQTDALHFRNVHDSLATIYPASRFVSALGKEATRRETVLTVNTGLNIAEEVGFVDLNLPDNKGQKVALSSLKGKVVMLHFWLASDNTCKMFNLDVIKPIYDEYHSKGLEIYQVALDTDKVVWGTTVKNQNLPWTNVCDGLGGNSPAATLYGVDSVPSSYFIVDGDIVEAHVNSAATLRKFLDSKLK